MIATMSHTPLTSALRSAVIVVALGLFPARPANAQTTLTLRANLPTEGTSKESGKKQVASAGQPSAEKAQPPAPPACPTFKLTAPTIPATSKGNHSVTLSWQASATKVEAANNAVGYCVFRRKMPGISKKISDCIDCQLVTENAIAGTGCIDNRVEDNKKYYYVVTYYVKPQGAGNGAISDVSNEALADTAKPEPTAPPYPPCH
jgi:hypothetical protein